MTGQGDTHTCVYREEFATEPCGAPVTGRGLFLCKKHHAMAELATPPETDEDPEVEP